tara:strand:- start:872 stop:1369 length:498 start_codon:yes stop_codon:yes gene_type:complete
MVESPEIELDRLPDDIDHNIVELVDTWYAALAKTRDGEMPSRTVLSADHFSRWRDDISIYEYQPAKDDFLIRLDAPSMIAARGESFLGSTPREIDLKFGTCLLAALRKTLKERRPTFFYVNLFGPQGEHGKWLRILLPAQTKDQHGNPVQQVLGARFAYEPKRYI